MFDLTKILDLSKKFALPNTFLKLNNCCTEVPVLLSFWDLKKNMLHKFCVCGTIGGPPLARKSPTCAYIVKNCGSGISISRGPRVLQYWQMTAQKCSYPQLLVRIDDAASSFKVQFIDVCAEN